jgi:hypothetical protein
VVGGDPPPPTTTTLSLPAPHHPHLIHTITFSSITRGNKTGTALRASGPGTTNCFLRVHGGEERAPARSSSSRYLFFAAVRSARRSLFCLKNTQLLFSEEHTTVVLLLPHDGGDVLLWKQQRNYLGAWWACDSWPPPKRLHCHHSSSPLPQPTQQTQKPPASFIKPCFRSCDVRCPDSTAATLGRRGPSALGSRRSSRNNNLVLRKSSRRCSPTPPPIRSLRSWALYVFGWAGGGGCYL